MTIDKQITDDFALLSLLLVFVLGYFAAVLPVVESLLASRPTETVVLGDWKRRVRSYLFLTIALTLLNVLVLAAFGSISVQVIQGWVSGDGHGFSLPRNGLLLIDAYIVATIAGGIWVSARLVGECRT